MREFNVALVEDEEEQAIHLKDLFSKLENEKKYIFHVFEYGSSIEFLETYKSKYDIIFLDIKMPGMNGMDLAKEIRKIDNLVPIIFVTSLAQYAIEGYQVHAVDYVLKPVNYPEFKLKMTRILPTIKEKNKNSLILENEQGVSRINFSSISYVETDGHQVIFHIVEDNGNNVIYRKYQSMKKTIEQLKDDMFLQINSCYLVNLYHIKSLSKNSVFLKDDTELLISRPRYASVEKAYLEFTHVNH